MVNTTAEVAPKDENELPKILWEYEFRNLEGELLTIVEATTSYAEQNEAIKSLIRRCVHAWRSRLPLISNPKEVKIVT